MFAPPGRHAGFPVGESPAWPTCPRPILPGASPVPVSQTMLRAAWCAVDIAFDAVIRSGAERTRDRPRPDRRKTRLSGPTRLSPVRFAPILRWLTRGWDGRGRDTRRRARHRHGVTRDASAAGPSVRAHMASSVTRIQSNSGLIATGVDDPRVGPVLFRRRQLRQLAGPGPSGLEWRSVGELQAGRFVRKGCRSRPRNHRRGTEPDPT